MCSTLKLNRLVGVLCAGTALALCAPEFAFAQNDEVKEVQSTGWIVAGALGVLVLILLMRDRGKRSQSKKDKPNEHNTIFKTEITHSQPQLTAQPKLRNARSGQATTKTSWIAPGSSITVSNREIGDMVYVGSAPKSAHYGERCRGYIDPSLAVAKIGDDYDGEDMSYWPNYRTITPRARATYLDWLATGRSDPEFNIGYMFLFFYGLERRLFQDSPTLEEAAALVQEAKRLQDVYKSNYSARSYLGRFIDAATVHLWRLDNPQPIFENHEHDLPLSLRFVIGDKIRRDEPLSAEWVLSWFMCHPERRLRTSATRCENEFRALFKLIFENKHPNGLKVTPPKGILRENYHAASGEFKCDLELKIDGQPVPDITRLRKPVNIAQKIADNAMAELDKFSRYVGRTPEGRGSVEAHALLPQQLWPQFPSSELDELRQWCHGVVSGNGSVSVADMVMRLEGQATEKVSKRQLESISDALARLGYGLAPDPRFAMRKPAPHEPIILFKLEAAVSKLDAASEIYRKKLTELTLAAFIAQADNQVLESEVTALKKIVSDAKPYLSDGEVERLEANLAWLLKVPPNFSLLRRHVSESDDQTRDTLKRLALAMANADGIIQPQEVRSIEKIYSALNIPTSNLYSDLHMSSTNSELVPVRAQTQAIRGEEIPAEPQSISSTAIIELNKDLIREKRAQTDEVSQLLAEIFSNEVSNETEASSETDHEEQGVLAKLSHKHQPFVRILMERTFWSEEDYGALTSRFGLMPSGALETVNEWAYDHFDEALIEAYKGYELNDAVIESIKSSIDEGKV